jgi:hypothetical protein
VHRGDRVAAVNRVQQRQLLGVTFQHICQLSHDGAAVAGRHPPPGHGRWTCCLHRCLDIGRAGVRHGRDDLLGHRALVVVISAADRGRQPAPDQQGPLTVQNLGQVRRSVHAKTTLSRAMRRRTSSPALT